jgi:hypothetical protein
MQILCATSSITFSCDHFPGFLSSREAEHPIFTLPQKKLLSYLRKWSGGELTSIDSYLLFLALLKSSDLVQFRVPAVRTPITDSIIAQNMEFLSRTVVRLNTVVNPSVQFPRYVVSPDTKDLATVHYWIQNWDDAYSDFASGKAHEYENRKLVQREAALERLIRNPHRPISSYASQLADWAAVAGEFPTALTISRLTGNRCSISEYWQQIIVSCTRDEKIFAINKEDLAELLEHCETTIHLNSGGIFSHTLFKVLRHAEKRVTNFLGLGDIDLSAGTYELLKSSDSVQDANLSAAIQAAPLEIPKKEQYPTLGAYLRAKLRYDMAKKAGQRDGS